MTDEEFLSYCEAHSETPRCGFTPANIARLLSLAGQDAAAKHWADKPPCVIDCTETEIKGLVKDARRRLTTFQIIWTDNYSHVPDRVVCTGITNKNLGEVMLKALRDDAGDGDWYYLHNLNYKLKEVHS